LLAEDSMRHFVALLCISLIACGASQPTVAEQTLPKHHPWRLFPLMEDNAWAYDVDTGDGDSVLAVSRVVNVIGNLVDVATGNESPSRYELREDGIFAIATGTYLIRQPVQVGATWPSGGEKVATVAAIDVAIETPAGNYRDCAAIEEVAAESGLNIRTVYCPDVGPVEVVSRMQLSNQEARVTARLRGAQVGGH
jgi:hypothetical protein